MTGKEPAHLRLLQKLRRLKRGKGVLNSAETGGLAHPKLPVAIVGDIHGRDDLLEKIANKIAKRVPGSMVIYVGDYVDRGPNSRAVLERVKNQTGHICLLGNHEAMMLEFLDDPIEKGARWLRNGGVATLASFDIELSERSTTNDVLAASKALKRTLEDGTEDWLRGLPLYWKSGNLLVTHAGPDPAKRIEDQDKSVFLWGHNRFLRDDRDDELWVAHGHWIRDRPSCANGRISVDTGAWKTGVLTAALIDPDGSFKFISAR